MKKLAAAIAAALLIAANGFAQAKGLKLVVEFVSGDEFTVTDQNQTVKEYGLGVFEGDSLPVGSFVKTGASTSAELKLVPNGTIIKLAPSTVFRVDALAQDAKGKNAFGLVTGKIRAVAALGGNYEIRSTTTVCGVRGTDFTYSFVEGVANKLMVGKGRVDFGKLLSDGKVAETISVGAGQFADFFGSAWKPADFTPDQYQAEFGDVGFDRLNPDEVTQAEPEKKPVDSTPAADVTGTAETAEPDKPEPEAAAKSAFMTWLTDVLGMEIGALTIDNVTYAKAVLQPTFTLGKLKMSLYLPIIYQSNLFDPDDWYHPAGNDEWSFGTDKGWGDHTLDAFVDALRDVILKFRYIEYGRQLDDPFFVKLGNLNSFRVGHGLLMDGYANDSDFPAIRRLGINLGMDLGGWGFEAMVNDALLPEIFGGRFYVKPLGQDFPLAFGVSAVTDLGPANMLDTEATPDASDALGDPAFIGAALDVDVPVIKRSDFLGLRFFTDVGAIVPYIRKEATGLSDTGLRWDLIFDPDSKKMKNWGLATGFLGNVLFIDWRLEFRYDTGLFRQGFFDAGYDRLRGQHAQAYAEYLKDIVTVDALPDIMGIYGEGEGKLFGDKITLTLGYFWPWTFETGLSDLQKELVQSSDQFVSRLEIKKGLIPVVDIHGSISYERRNLYRTIAGLDGDAELFDENTVFKGEVVVPVPKAPGLDLAVIFATAVRRDPATGDVIYKSGKPEIVPVISLETRLSF